MNTEQAFRNIADSFRHFADSMDQLADRHPELEQWQAEVFIEVGKQMVDSLRKLTITLSDA